jgi:predicted acylesterase/phospholipase RssA
VPSNGPPAPCLVSPLWPWLDSRDRGQRARRAAEVEAILRGVDAPSAVAFNAHVVEASGLCIYGCANLAAAHVGALRALERHGLDYSSLETMAGVSAGSVVIAMLAVGYTAEELIPIIESLPFRQLARPELGSLLRAASSMLQRYFWSGGHEGDGGDDRRDGFLRSLMRRITRGNGPGLTSGVLFERTIGDSLLLKCGKPDITLLEVRRRFGKRLVIVVTELNSGKERHLTPETHPHMPVRVAVRMSMGVPGLMEPFRYGDNLYCDGAMTNDFPMHVLPKKGRCVARSRS